MKSRRLEVNQSQKDLHFQILPGISPKRVLKSKFRPDLDCKLYTNKMSYYEVLTTILISEEKKRFRPADYYVSE